MKVLLFIIVIILTTGCGGAGSGARGEDLDGRWSYATKEPTVEKESTVKPFPTDTVSPPQCVQVLPTPEFCLEHPTVFITGTKTFTRTIQEGQEARYLTVELEVKEIGPKHFTIELAGPSGAVYLPLPGAKNGEFTFRIPLDDDSYTARILWAVENVEVKAK